MKTSYKSLKSTKFKKLIAITLKFYLQTMNYCELNKNEVVS